MGKAISQGNRRDKVFLMTKCCGGLPRTPSRTWKTACGGCKPIISTSGSSTNLLRQRPGLDLCQGGAHRIRLKAKEQGKIRFLGFTGTRTLSIHLKMLDKPYPWATVQMPLNVMDGQFRSFQHKSFLS